MKNHLVFVFTAAFISAIMLGCVQPPDQELQAAKASLDSALAVQADKYAPGDYKCAKDTLDGATAEIDKQNAASPLKKDYAKAKSMLASATAAANSAKLKATEGKKQASTEADAAITKANTILIEVKGLVEKTPKGTSDADALISEVTAIEASIGEAQSANGSGDYLIARDKANASFAKLDSLKNAIAAASVKKPAKGKM